MTISTQRSCAVCSTKNTPMWRWGSDGERSLCNACGVRAMKDDKSAAAKEAKAAAKGAKVAAASFKSAAVASRRAERAITKKMPRTWQRPSRSKAAVAARKHVAVESDEVPWAPEHFCCGEGFDVGSYFYDADDDMEDDMAVHFDMRGGEPFDDPWRLEDYGLENMVYEIDDCYELGKHDRTGPVSPRSPFSMVF